MRDPCAAHKVLAGWARHTSDCQKCPRVEHGVTYGAALPPAPCTCGLDAALAAAGTERNGGPLSEKDDLRCTGCGCAARLADGVEGFPHHCGGTFLRAPL